MSFLYPSLLLALSALAIPIIVHLFNFRKHKKIYFSNVQFLKEIKEETASRSKIKHWLVLLCRLMALTFLILAFAQPFIPNSHATQQNQNVSIFIDNSYSMAAKYDDATLLEQAKEKAMQIVNAYPNQTQYQILDHGFEGRMQRMYSKEAALNYIQAIQISPNTHSLPQVQARQHEALKVNTAAQKTAYILSDFQEYFCQPTSDSILQTKLIPMRATNADNVFIDSIGFATPILGKGQNIQLVYRIQNQAEKEQSRQVVLKVNETEKAEKNITIEGNSYSIDTLSFSVSEGGWQEASIQITDFPIQFDDTYYFTFNADEQIKVMILNDGAENKYFNAVFLSDASFVWRNVQANSVSQEELNTNQIIILNNLGQISGNLSSWLKSFVNNGGSVFIFPKESIDKNSYNTFLSEINADQLGAWTIATEQVSQINTQEEEYKEVFQRIDENIDLPIVKKYYQFTGGYSNRSPLLTLKNGQALINKYKVGNGKVYLSAAPCSEDATSLPLNAVFLPLIYKSGLLSKASTQTSYTLGQDQQVVLRNTNLPSEVEYRLKSNSNEFIPTQSVKNKDLYLGIKNTISESDIYQLQNNKAERLASFAFNQSRNESYTKFFAASDLKNLYSLSNISIIEQLSNDISDTIKSHSEGVVLWKYCIVLCLLFLLVEALVLRFV